MTTSPPIDLSAWHQACRHVSTEMTEFLKPYRTGVYADLVTHGEGWGSGSYLSVRGQPGILTNCHVSEGRTASRNLTHLLKDDDTLHLLVGANTKVDLPLDLSFMPIRDAIWSGAHGSKTIEPYQLRAKHAPIQHEMLAFTGFPGDRNSFFFDTMFAKATCLTTQEVALPDDDDRFDPTYHFGLHYSPDKATDVIGTEGLAVPPGLSGSTVWDTGFVQALEDRVPWTPEHARVTGVIWGWPSNRGCLVATRIEYVRDFLDVVGETSSKP